jgi:subtilisin family serine protease
MKKPESHWSRFLCALVLVLLTPSQMLAGPSSPPSASIDSRVLEEMAVQGSASYWVILEQQADLSDAAMIQDWNARGQYVYDRLTSLAAQTQSGLASVLAKNGVEYTRYWIVNAVLVNSDESVMRQVAAQPEVERIAAPTTLQIPEPIPGTEESTIDAVEWNITRINAPEVWSTFGVRGEGIVVANIDTGVQYNHPALVSQYRGYLGGGAFDHNYNWFDPSGVCGNPSLVPCDNHGHGTHTMGIMVGDDGADNQIGVAPGAHFIMAKGCESNYCSDTALLASAQWILAPTDLSGANPRPDLRPHVVNNSWGDAGGDSWFQDVVQAWVASGIFPVFSNGNFGTGGCDTAGSPGDYPDSYSVGAFDANNAIASFSSRGPSASIFGGITKPNIAAPGVNVRSSLPGGSYGVVSGTSMAAPHVAGTVALLWSADPVLVGDIAATRAILDQSAADTSDLQCGGTPENNNVWGEGRLDAFAAVSRTLISPAGALQGVVTDYNDGLGISGATVSASEDGTMVQQVLTSDSGSYDMLLPLGIYEVEASASGYQTGTVRLTLDTNGATYIQSFDLRTARGEVGPASLTFLVPPGESRTRTLVLSNTGSLPMDWQITESGGERVMASATAAPERSPDDGGNVPTDTASYDTILADVEWLAATPAGGTVLVGGQQTILIITDATNTELGGYLASIIIQTNSGREAHLAVPVRLVVSDLNRQFVPLVLGGSSTD